MHIKTAKILAGLAALTTLVVANVASAQTYPTARFPYTYEPLSASAVEIADEFEYTQTYMYPGGQNGAIPTGIDLGAAGLNFTLRYYGVNKSIIYVGGNGGVKFNLNGDWGQGTYLTSSNTTFPATGNYDGVEGVVAPWWDSMVRNDWGPINSSPLSGGIKYEVVGTSPNRVLKVQWENFAHYWCYDGPTSAGNYYNCGEISQYSWQVWFYESNGVDNSIIQFMYDDYTEGAESGYAYVWMNTLTGSVGIEEDVLSAPRGVNVLSCTPSCTRANWPAQEAILIGAPSGVEMIGSAALTSQVATPVELTIGASFTLRNLGQTNAASVAYTAYLSLDRSVDPATDLVLGAPAAGIAVNQQASATDAQTFTVPRPANGAYHVCVSVDPANVIAEAIEINNTSCTREVVLVGPDLRGSFTTPDIAGPGDELDISYDFRNSGVDDSGLFTWRVVMSSDDVLSADDTEIYSEPADIVANGRLQGTARPTIPSDIIGFDQDEVPFYVFIELDSTNNVAEAYETNNAFARTGGAITLIKADLVIDALTMDLPEGCYFGQPINVSMNVLNTGGARARGFEHAVLMSDNAIITTTGRDFPVRYSPLSCDVDADCMVALGGQAFCAADPGSGASFCSRACSVDADCTSDDGISEGLSCLNDVCQNFIPPYSEQAIAFSGFIPTENSLGQPLADGQWFFGAVSDGFDEVIEGNETNNTRAAGPFLCQTPAPDFQSFDLRGPASAAAGEQIIVSRVISNTGIREGTVTWRYLLSSNPIISNEDMPLVFINAGAGTLNLAIGEERPGSDLLRLPGNLAPGTYYIGLVLDPDNTEPELFENNNVKVSSNATVVVASSLRVATRSLPNAVQGLPYNRQLIAVGGAGDYEWTALNAETEQWPPGITINSDGVISGTATTPGLYQLTVKVSSGGLEVRALIPLTVVSPSGPLAVYTQALPPAYVGIPYNVGLAASGGAPPYTFSLVGGQLPTGVELRNNTLFGTPQVADDRELGALPFTVRVRDSRGAEAEAELTLKVLEDADLSIGTVTLSEALVNQPYAQVIQGRGGEVPYTFTITGLPDGLSYMRQREQTVLITGQPTQAGSFRVEATLEDAAGQRATQTYTLTVIGQVIDIRTTELPPVEWENFETAKPYSFQLASNPSQGITWQLRDSELPVGFTLTEAGVIEGLADVQLTRPGTYLILVEARDNAGGSGLAGLALYVPPPPLEPPVTTTPDDGCSTGGEANAALSGLLLIAGLALLRRRR